MATKGKFPASLFKGKESMKEELKEAKAIKSGKITPMQYAKGVTYGPTGVEYTGTLSILVELSSGNLVKVIGRKTGILL